MEESAVRFSVPPIRIKICSKNIHKMYEASYVSPDISWSSGNYLDRRFSVDGKECTGSGGNRFLGSKHISTSRFSNQRKEILSLTDSINHVLGLRHTVQMTVSLPQERVQQILKEIQNLLLRVQPKIRSVARHTASCCSLSCSFPRPPILSLFGKRQNEGLVSSSNIPRENNNIFRINNRIKMVDSKFRNSQWETSTISRSDHNYNNRCFQERLGGGGT